MTRTARTPQQPRPLPNVRQGARPNEFFVESQSVTFLEWRVMRDYLGNLTCTGNTDKGKCWQFSGKGYCKHTTATEKHLLDAKRRKAAAMTPAQKFMSEGGSLADLMDYGNPPAAIRSGRVKEEW